MRGMSAWRANQNAAHTQAMANAAVTPCRSLNASASAAMPLVMPMAR